MFFLNDAPPLGGIRQGSGSAGDPYLQRRVNLSGASARTVSEIGRFSETFQRQRRQRERHTQEERAAKTIQRIWRRLRTAHNVKQILRKDFLEAFREQDALAAGNSSGRQEQKEGVSASGASVVGPSTWLTTSEGGRDVEHLLKLFTFVTLSVSARRRFNSVYQNRNEKKQDRLNREGARSFCNNKTVELKSVESEWKRRAAWLESDAELFQSLGTLLDFWSGQESKIMNNVLLCKRSVAVESGCAPLSKCQPDFPGLCKGCSLKQSLLQLLFVGLSHGSPRVVKDSCLPVIGKERNAGGLTQSSWRLAACLFKTFPESVGSLLLHFDLQHFATHSVPSISVQMIQALKLGGSPASKTIRRFFACFLLNSPIPNNTSLPVEDGIQKLPRAFSDNLVDVFGVVCAKEFVKEAQVHDAVWQDTERAQPKSSHAAQVEGRRVQGLARRGDEHSARSTVVVSESVYQDAGPCSLSHVLSPEDPGERARKAHLRLMFYGQHLMLPCTSATDLMILDALLTHYFILCGRDSTERPGVTRSTTKLGSPQSGSYIGASDFFELLMLPEALRSARSSLEPPKSMALLPIHNGALLSFCRIFFPLPCVSCSTSKSAAGTTAHLSKAHSNANNDETSSSESDESDEESSLSDKADESADANWGESDYFVASNSVGHQRMNAQRTGVFSNRRGRSRLFTAAEPPASRPGSSRESGKAHLHTQLRMSLKAIQKMYGRTKRNSQSPLDYCHLLATFPEATARMLCQGPCSVLEALCLWLERELHTVRERCAPFGSESFKGADPRIAEDLLFRALEDPNPDVAVSSLLCRIVGITCLLQLVIRSAPALTDPTNKALNELLPALPLDVKNPYSQTLSDLILFLNRFTWILIQVTHGCYRPGLAVSSDCNAEGPRLLSALNTCCARDVPFLLGRALRDIHRFRPEIVPQSAWSALYAQDGCALLKPTQKLLDQLDGVRLGSNLHLNNAKNVADVTGECSAVAIESLSAILTHLPHTLSFQDRAIIFLLLVVQNKVDVLGVGAASSNLFNVRRGVPLRIRRSDPVTDTFQSLNQARGMSWKQPLQVSFVDEFGNREEGVDGGGLFREYITLMSRTLCSPNYGLFEALPDGSLVPNMGASTIHGARTDTLFQLTGSIVGKALYEEIILEPVFNRVFLSLVQNRKEAQHLEDLAFLDPELFKQLKQLPNYDNIENLQLTFSVTIERGKKRSEEVDLVPNGRSIIVNAKNLDRYRTKLVEYHLKKKYAEEATAFRLGLSNVLPLHWIQCFNDLEFSRLISGEQLIKLDVADLASHAELEGGYTAESTTVQDLWTVLEKFSEQQRAQFLMFVTSCPRPPFMGFRMLHPRFRIVRVERTTQLPSACTCLNQLNLPDYRDQKQLQKKLLIALELCGGFHIS